MDANQSGSTIFDQLEAKLTNIVKKLGKYSLSLLALSLLLILAMPFLLAGTGKALIAFNGPVGDTIGGIVGPFVGLISAILVFYSFNEQKKANDLIKKQREEDRKFDNAMFLYNNLLRRSENVRIKELQTGEYHTGKQGIEIIAFNVFYHIPILWFGGGDNQEMIDENRQKIVSAFNKSFTANELFELSMQLENFAIYVVNTYYTDEKQRDMSTLGFLMEQLGFVYNEYYQNMHVYVRNEYSGLGYWVLEDNILSKGITKLDNLRTLILTYSTSGQLQAQ